jgi:centromeric protein E
MLQDLEKDDCTPPSRRFMDFPGRPEGCQTRGSALNFDAESETLSRAGSMLSEITTTRGAPKANGSVAGDTEFTGIGEFVAELKEMAQYQKQLGGQVWNYLIVSRMLFCSCEHITVYYLQKKKERNQCRIMLCSL